MEINDLIYKEIECIDLEKSFECEDEDLKMIYNEVLSRDLCGKPFNDLNEDEFNEFLFENDYSVAFKRVKIDSLLYNALRYWFCAWDDYRSVAACVRGGYINNGCLYFCTGYGYDTLSSDLLGCSASGRARDAFIKFCNECERVMCKGGRSYMYALGYGDDVFSALESTKNN